MKNYLTRLALSALFLVGTISVPAFAQQNQTPQPAAVPTGPINYKLLNLSPEQTKKLNEMRIEFSKKAIRLKADIQIKHLDIQKQLMSPAVNPNLVRKLMQEKLALESQLQSSSLEFFLAFKKMLTPTQLAKLPQAITPSVNR